MGIPCTRCVSHTGYLVRGNSKGEARGRNTHRNNSNIVRNMESNNVGTKRWKSPKQGLTSAEDLDLYAYNNKKQYDHSH